MATIRRDGRRESIEMAMYAIELAAATPAGGAARRPHVADPRHGVRRRADDRHRVRQLLRAARHRRQRHHQDDALLGAARAARSTPTSWPSCAPTRRSIPGAVEEILRWANPLHYFRRTATADTELARRRDRGRRQGGDVLHVGQPRRGRVRRPAARSTSTATRTRTCRSASPSTSASACTWPGSRGACSSRSCSPRSRRSS